MRDDDIIIHVDGKFEGLASIAAMTDAEAVRAAGEAWKRDEAGPDHMADLFMAVVAMRGPFIARLEAELNAYRRLAGDKVTAEGQAEYLAPLREEMRRLFRTDAEAVIREAAAA